jgi:hypothetical protein
MKTNYPEFVVPQIPAEGILLRESYGDAKAYAILCTCGDTAHSHHLWVEANDCGVDTTLYVDVKTDYWYKVVPEDINSKFAIVRWLVSWGGYLINTIIRRIKLTYQVWVKGYIECQGTVMMSPQQAANYASVLQQASIDVLSFRKQRVATHDNQTTSNPTL